METKEETIEVHLPYDCWVTILNFLDDDLKKDTWTNWRSFNKLDIWLLILRSVSRKLHGIIDRLRHERGIVLGFAKGAVNQYFSAKGYFSCLQYTTTTLRYHVGTAEAEEAVTGGHFGCLKFIASNAKISWDSVVQKAAKGGNLQCLEYCHAHGISSNMLDDSAALGNLEMLKYIRPHLNSDFVNRYTIQAAKNNRLNILQYAVESGDGLDQSICIHACESDRNYECLVYAHQHGAALDDRCLQVALLNGAYKCALYVLPHVQFRAEDFIVFPHYEVPCGDLELLKALHHKGVVWGIYTYTSVIQGGNLECLRFLLTVFRGYPYHSCYSSAVARSNWHKYFTLLEEFERPYLGTEYEAAAKYGKVDCMAYLHEVRMIPWPKTLTREIAENGDYACFVYAHQHGCLWHEDTCLTAAKRGDLKFLKYAHENGAKWDERTTFRAASLGRLEQLKYAHEHGCPWSHRAIREADLKGHKECVEYMQSQGLKLINTYAWE